MLARVVNNIYQGGLLNQLCFNNVAYELLQSTTNKKLHPWSNSYTHFCQFRNMSKDGTKSDASIKVLGNKQFQKNVNFQKNPKLLHDSSSNIENIKKVYLKPQVVLKRAILQESGDKILQQANESPQSCKTLKKSGSGPKCLVENKEYHKPFKKTVAFDLRPRVLQQCANPFQCRNIHCIKPYGTLVGILKKSKESLSRNVFPKPYFIKKSIYCTIQSQARNFCQNRPPAKINTENQETNLGRQDTSRKQITSQILEKNAPLNEQQLENQPPPLPVEMKSVQPSFTQATRDYTHTLKENKNIILKTISKSMNNLNTYGKSQVKFPRPNQTKESCNLRKCRRALYRVPSVAKSVNRLAFSTSSGDYKDKNRCKSSGKRKRKSRPQRAKKCKSKADSSGNKCNSKNAEQRTQVLKCIYPKEDMRDPEETAKLLESCFPKTEMSSGCDSTPMQTTCEETTKHKHSKPSDKTRGVCEKSPQSKKPKCETEDKKGVIDVGCKSSLQKMCRKVTNQITEYAEKKKKMKKKKKIEPCELTCHDVCADDGITKDGEVPPGSKRNCKFICENGGDPCDPPKRKKASKTNIFKEKTKKKKCSKKPKKKEIKSSETEKKKKIQRRSSSADLCSWFQKAFRKKPQLYSGECEKPKKKSQRIKVCENSFKKMLRKMQKRKQKTC